MKRKRLGDALLDSKLITPQQLNDALAKQKAEKKRLGRVLIDSGMVTDDQIATALSEQLEIPFIAVEDLSVPDDLKTLIPETIIRTHSVLAYKCDGRILTLVMADPLDVFIVEEVKFQTRLDIEEAIASEAAIKAVIRQVYGPGPEERAGSLGDAVKTLEDEKAAAAGEKATLGGEAVSFDLLAVDEAASVNFVSKLIKQAIVEKASDIHLEPQESCLRVRFRMDGVCHELFRVPLTSKGEIISRLKIMADMDISEKRLPQDGRIRVKVNDRNVDLRVSSLPTIWGEKICMRILDKSALSLSLKDVGLTDDMRAKFEVAVKQPNGIILLNGPTGSGKTSTLYAALNFIISPKTNISTAEDPVEMQVADINQVHVKADIGLTFARTLRALMRQDPNVIMIGEIRDGETAQIACEAAMTGHLVLSTLHTNDAPGTVNRLVDMGVEPFIIATSLLAAVAQRLTRRICPKCITPYVPTEKDLKDLNLKSFKFTEELKFFKGTGCPNCKSVGYRGRCGIHEMMTLDDELRKMIVSKVSSADLRKAAVARGMSPLRKTGITKAIQGITTIEEILRVTQVEEL